ncbi:hypothetical protein LTS03_002724 [Exophiala xenobiotica]|nr:hypothetical protein LTR92_004834 [Exophiala xenobiotica]KAK5209929.1 hypothetical protein LTR41_004561 [Exophiala xenobiotica]KAK5261800.1 hypothetical protein LTR40_001543 [Exophiala xenobiotica]KAK5330168.1 hypothetical protein LTR93_001757 [Exophiala xenobiotica]KAK5351592.1 hypothetical protein LTR61_004942 [Exophiala xenobiotica]
MSGIDTNLAESALTIALVALVISLFQLLQQYFSTADGYRNCQRAVMGRWAQRTRRHFIAREFRFETLFTVPDIFLAGDGAAARPHQILITGTVDSRKATLIPLEAFLDKDEFRRTSSFYQDVEKTGMSSRQLKSLRKSIENPSDELVCWLPLLHWLHETTKASLDPDEIPQNGNAEMCVLQPLRRKRLPALTKRERSWDFQPPDVSRPLAKSTVSDIAVLARRMGMKWKMFRPEEGIMRAEGHSHIITSTLVRSLGTVLHYRYTGQARRLDRANTLYTPTLAGSPLKEQEEIYIASPNADRLGCGVIRGDGTLRVPNFIVGSRFEVSGALNVLDDSGESTAQLEEMYRLLPQFTLRAIDIVAMSTFMGFKFALRRFKETYMQHVKLSHANAEVTCQPEHVRSLQLNPGVQTLLILEACSRLSDNFPHWDRETTPKGTVRRDIVYLDVLSSYHKSMTNYLMILQNDFRLRYTDLLKFHIRFAIFRPPLTPNSTRPETQKHAPGEDVRHQFDQIDKIRDAYRRSHPGTQISDLLFVDAWASMMFRACCWGACHILVPGERVPSEYYGSQLPVYIG